MGLHSGNLLAAARDSCCPLLAFRRDLIKRPAVAVELSLLARVLLVPLANHISVSDVQFHQPARTAQSLARDQRRAGSAEEVHDQVTRLAAGGAKGPPGRRPARHSVLILSRFAT